MASRRGAEKLIFDGKISVNGHVVLIPQTLVCLKEDDVRVEDCRIHLEEEKVIYLLNKPRGYVSTNAPDRKKRVIDLFPDDKRLFTVGRLDRDTTGLLLITNDGHFAQRFSVRKNTSNWSQLNFERLRLLVNEGNIMPEVLEALPDLSVEEFEVPADILVAIKANDEAWRNYQGFSAPYIRIRISYIDAARSRPEEFDKRLENFIKKSEQNKLIGQGGVEKYY